MKLSASSSVKSRLPGLVLAGPGLAEDAEQQLGEVAGARHAPPHVEERPAEVARHVLVREAVEGRQHAQAVVEQAQRVADGGGHGLRAPAPARVEVVERAPGLQREPVAGDAGDAVDVVERARQAVVPVGRGHEVAGELLDQPGVGRLPLGRHLALLLGEQDLERGAAGAQLLARRAVLLQAAETDAQARAWSSRRARCSGRARTGCRRRGSAGPAASARTRAARCVGRHRLVKGGGVGVAHHPHVARLPVRRAQRHGVARDRRSWRGRPA